MNSQKQSYLSQVSNGKSKFARHKIRFIWQYAKDSSKTIPCCGTIPEAKHKCETAVIWSNEIIALMEKSRTCLSNSTTELWNTVGAGMISMTGRLQKFIPSNGTEGSLETVIILWCTSGKSTEEVLGFWRKGVYWLELKNREAGCRATWFQAFRVLRPESWHHDLELEEQEHNVCPTPWHPC